jgi:hypothetical protein
MSKAVLSGVIAGFFAGAVATAAVAEEARLGDAATTSAPAPAPAPLSMSVIEPLTINYLSPVFGNVTLGLVPDNYFAVSSVYGVAPVLAPDFAADYQTRLLGSDIGLFAGYTGGDSLFMTAPTAGWNFGASLGYRGFYFEAGLSDSGQQRLTPETQQGWLAGFGYRTGGLNLRLRYMAAQSLTSTDQDSDNRTWIIGGIYQISPRLRVNADAFTGGRELRVNSAPQPASAAPQGTGARVGVQLRF